MPDVTDVVALLSQRSSLFLLDEMGPNPDMVTNVLIRLMDAIEEWEGKGVTLDPVEFEVVTDVMVKHFAASFLASQSLLKKCQCPKGFFDGEADADVASG